MIAHRTATAGIRWCCKRCAWLWREATPPGRIAIPILLLMLFLAVF